MVDRKEEMKAITEKLESGIKELFSSEKYSDYLRTMSKFTNYSLNNSLLIYMQKPDATAIAGYRAWETKFERHVKRGETGIRILAPAPYRKEVEQDKLDANGNVIRRSHGTPVTERVTKVIQAYKPISVFDVSQTEGKPLPEIVHTLEGNVDGYENFVEALKRTSPVEIRSELIQGEANGYYHLADKTIVVDARLPEKQALKTTIHEISHAVLHDRDTGIEKEADRRTREVQAESVAYTVCQRYGIDTSDYSFAYVGTWAQDKDLAQLRDSMDVIRKTANDLIDGIDRHLDDIRLEQATEIAYQVGDHYLMLSKVPGRDSYDYSLYDKDFKLERINTIDGCNRIDRAADLVLRDNGLAHMPRDEIEIETVTQGISSRRQDDVAVERESQKVSYAGVRGF